MTTVDAKPGRSERIALRVTPEERDLLQQAAATAGDTLTGFVVESAKIAALRALADQPGIVLDAEAWEQWEELNRRPARDLPRLREFMQRPAPVFDG